MKPEIFICHCVHDKEIVSNLEQIFVEEGFDTRTDLRVIRDGEPLQEPAKEAIQNASSFIIAISPDAPDSVWVQQETQYALQIQKERPEYHILPLLLNGAQLGALKWLIPEDTHIIEMGSEPENIRKAWPEIFKALPEDIFAVKAKA